MSRAPWNNVLHPAAGAAGLPPVTASAAAGHRGLQLIMLKELLGEEMKGIIRKNGSGTNILPLNKPFIFERAGLRKN